LSEEITRKVRPPRALYPGFPLGHPLSYPDHANRQLQVLRLLLKYLEKLNAIGTIVKIDMTNGNNFVANYPSYVTG
jgi:hypothetical protein